MKSSVITIRVTEEFKQEIEKRASNKSLSKYIRKTIERSWEQEEKELDIKEIKKSLEEIKNKSPSLSDFANFHSSLLFAIGNIISFDHDIKPFDFIQQNQIFMQENNFVERMQDNLTKREVEDLFFEMLQFWDKKYNLSDMAKHSMITIFLTWIGLLFQGVIFDAGKLTIKFVEYYKKLSI